MPIGAAKEIQIAEVEMPGLMAIRHEYASAQPLKGARISGSLHMTIQTAVLIETLTALGAEVRWASCNIFSTQDHAAAAIVKDGVSVFAKKAKPLRNTGEFTHRIFEWPDGGFSNMILDDGGDATLLLHLGSRAESDRNVIANPTNDEEHALFAAIAKHLDSDPHWYSKRLKNSRRLGRNNHRCTPPLPNARTRRTEDSRHQRERLRHQVKVRQPLRLPRTPWLTASNAPPT